jgi:hypothetical protein
LPVTAALLLAACGTYVPDGATVVKVNNSRIEFDRAELRPKNELQKGDMVRMKWYEENTYITTATLDPGVYSFRARSYNGGGLARDITIKPDVHLYEINAGTGAAGAGDDADQDSAAGPVLKGKLALGPGQRRPASVSVLFIGTSIELRTATLAADGSFQTNFPQKGNWRIEVHVPGTQPLSYIHKPVNAQADINLGPITLQ